MTIPTHLQHTPWDAAQACDRVAEGIHFISTAGHGGYHLSPQRRREMPASIQAITSPYSPTQAGWYEEDCDWAIPVIGLAEHFDAQTCYNAVRTARGAGNYLPLVALRNWLDRHTDNLAEAKARAYAATIEGKWERGGLSGGREPGWLVHLSREGEHRTARFAEYPTQQFYTEAEIQAALLPPVQTVERPAFTPVAFHEAECGGVFDGHQVLSDADPGL